MRPRSRRLLSRIATSSASGISTQIATSEKRKELRKACQNRPLVSTSVKLAKPTHSVAGPTPSQSKNEYHQLATMGQRVKATNSSSIGARKTYCQACRRSVPGRRRRGVAGGRWGGGATCSVVPPGPTVDVLVTSDSG